MYEDVDEEADQEEYRTMFAEFSRLSSVVSSPVNADYSSADYSNAEYNPLISQAFNEDDLLAGRTEHLRRLNLDDIPITTITSVTTVDMQLNTNACFLLFDLYDIDFLIPKTKRFKLPIVNKPGAIISFCYAGQVRGIRRGKFKNSMTIGMCLGEKNVSVKLSKNTIHVCGSKSEDHVHSCTKYVTDHVQKADRILKIIRKYPDIIDWIGKMSEGDIQIYPSHRLSLECFSEGFLQLTEEELFKHLSSLYPEEEEENKERTQLAMFLVGKAREFYREKFVEASSPFWPNDRRCFLKYLNNIKNLDDIYTGTLRVKDIRYCMVNYNYNIGFRVNKIALKDVFDKREGFDASFFNDVSNNVYVKAETKAGNHILLVHDTGSITQTSGDWNGMKAIFDKFKRILLENSQVIISLGSVKSPR